MTRPKPQIALCGALSISDGEGVPEWLHLLPAGEARTNDGRGPYRVADAAQLMAASLRAGDKLVLDENHSTDLAAPKGEPAPARGWIVELQSRADGIWGRVEWTGEGRRLAEDKAYRGVSPVITHRKDGVITGILRASLVNAPNLVGLASLHQEERDMDLKMKLIEALGLDSAADDEAIVAALKSKLEAAGTAKAEDDKAALQAALAPIAKAAGLAEDADAVAVLTGVQALAAKRGSAAESDAVIALQSEITTLAGTINDMVADTAKKAAEAFVDGAIAEGRVGVKPLRDDYVAMHMENPARTEKQIKAMPVVKGSRASALPPEGGASDGLGEADRQVIALMGIDPEAFKKTRAAQAADKEEAL